MYVGVESLLVSNKIYLLLCVHRSLEPHGLPLAFYKSVFRESFPFPFVTSVFTLSGPSSLSFSENHFSGSLIFMSWKLRHENLYSRNTGGSTDIKYSIELLLVIKVRVLNGGHGSSQKRMSVRKIE